MVSFSLKVCSISGNFQLRIFCGSRGIVSRPWLGCSSVWLDDLVADKLLDVGGRIAQHLRQYFARVLPERRRRLVTIERRRAQVHGILDGFDGACVGMRHG